MIQYGKSGGGLLYRKTLTNKNVLKFYINDPILEVGGELLYKHAKTEIHVFRGF